MIQTESQLEPIVNDRGLPSSEPETEVSLLDIPILVLERKRFVMGFVLAAFLLAIGISLLISNQYEGKITLLPPQQNSSVGSALLGQLGSIGSLGSLASLAGGSFGLKNPSDMYV